MDKFNLGIQAIGHAAPRTASIEKLLSPRIVAAAIAILLGTGILFVAGFSSNDFVHAAAHDVRHAAGFPCH